MRENIILLALCCALCVPLQVLASVARVDTAYIYQEYSLVKEGYVAVNKAQQVVEKLAMTADKEIAELRDKGEKEEVIAKKHEEIQSILDKEIANLYKTKEDYDKRINESIDRTLEQFAKEKKLDLILDSGFVSSGGVDLTDEFLARLERQKK